MLGAMLGPLEREGAFDEAAAVTTGVQEHGGGTHRGGG
jgi:hypothetical protein